MNEDIELHTFSTREPKAKDSDIEEYHELNALVKYDSIETSSAPSPNSSTRLSKDYEFFAEHDVKTAQKNSKKKELKLKEKAPTTTSLMDIISLELASVTLPVRENVISKMDVTSRQRDSFLEYPPRSQRVLHRNPQLDYEYGWGDKPDPVKLNPIFPKIHKNEVNYQYIEVQYVEPKYSNEIIQYDPEKTAETKFLDIQLKDIQFTHHHLFSLEKLLCAKLSEAYKEYNNVKKIVKDLESDIKINRETRDSLKVDLNKISPNKKDTIRFDKTVRKYTGNVIELKEKYFKTLQRQKEITHKMIILWCDIEMVREKTEITGTNYLLMISKEAIDDKAYDDLKQEVFNTEYSDMLDKLEYEYVTKYLEYKQDKQPQNLDDSAKRNINKPKLEIDEELLKDEVEGIVSNMVEKEKYQLFLKEDIKATKDGITTKDSNKVKHFFEVYVDDVFVCESEKFSQENKHEFSIEFTESFSVEILPKNSKLTLTLNENDRAVASTTLNLADVKKSYNDADILVTKFVYNDIIEPNVKHVGSGHNIKDIASQNKVRLKSSNFFKGNLYTACEVNIKVGWSEKLIQTQSEIIKSSMETGRQIKRLLQGIDKPNTGDLIDLITKVYEKDVSQDENIVNNLLNICKTEYKAEDMFPIDVNSPDITRLRLLHLRNTGAFSDIDGKVVPIHASQVSTEQLNCIQKNNDRESSYLSDKYGDMDPIDLQRHIGSKFVQRLNKNLLKNLNDSLLRKTHKDVVRDFKDLSLRSLLSGPILSLSSLSSSSRLQLLANDLAKQQTVSVAVLRAHHLRQRLREDDDGEEIAGYKLHPLRPFVRVTYKNHSTDSGTALGCQPTWNQTLQIHTRLDPLTTLYIDIFDEYKHHVDTESSSDHNERHTAAVWLGGVEIPLQAVISQTGLRGTFKVSTPANLLGYETQPKESSHSLLPDITRLMRNDSTFLSLHITTSLSHLGGFECYNQPNDEDDYIIKHLNTFVTEYTNEFPSRNLSLTYIDSSGKHKCITQFLQPIPLPDYEYFPKNTRQRSESSALSKSSVLSKSSSSSERKRDGDGTNISGEEKESLYSAASWKNEEDQLNKMMDVAARYVALIPTYEVTESHTVTLLGLELLKVALGSPLDHAILLFGYFLSLGLQPYLCSGYGPRGQTVAVITGYDQDSKRYIRSGERIRSRGILIKGDPYSWSVWDACSGQRGHIRDVGCVLNTVHTVFNCDNIWVNVQSSLECERLSLDFHKSSEWRPVFTKSIFVPTRPILDSVGLYQPPPDGERLRLRLERKLKDKIQKWRPYHKTVWNRYCSAILRDTLPQWEHWALHREGSKPAHGTRMRQLMASYKVLGVCVNVPYSSQNSFIRSIRRTIRPLCVTADTDFALAVTVHTYPNNVVSVWVYLAAIAPL